MTAIFIGGVVTGVILTLFGIVGLFALVSHAVNEASEYELRSVEQAERPSPTIVNKGA